MITAFDIYYTLKRELISGPSFIFTFLYKIFPCTLISFLFFCRAIFFVTDRYEITNFNLEAPAIATPEQGIWFLLFGLCLDLLIRPAGFHKEIFFRKLFTLNQWLVITVTSFGVFGYFFILNWLEISDQIITVPYKIYFFMAYFLTIYFAFNFEVIRTFVDKKYRLITSSYKFLDNLFFNIIRVLFFVACMSIATVQDIWVHIITSYQELHSNYPQYGIWIYFIPSEAWIYIICGFQLPHVFSNRIISS